MASLDKYFPQDQVELLDLIVGSQAIAEMRGGEPYDAGLLAWVEKLTGGEPATVERAKQVARKFDALPESVQVELHRILIDRFVARNSQA